MRFLLDENLDAGLVLPFRASGHDATSVAALLGTGSPDLDVLSASYREGRVLVTADQGFGALVFQEGTPHAGVILLRFQLSTFERTWSILDRVLREHSGDLQEFLVVTERSVRVRRLGE